MRVSLFVALIVLASDAVAYTAIVDGASLCYLRLKQQKENTNESTECKLPDVAHQHACDY